MVRKLVCGFLVLAVFTGILLADEVKGKFKKYEKGTVTVTVDDKDHQFKLSKESKVYNGDDEVKGKERRVFWKDLKEGADITVTYDKEGDKVNVTQVKVKK
jgi:hypothetical protein